MEHLFVRLPIQLRHMFLHEERILGRRHRGHRHPLRDRHLLQEYHPARARHVLLDLTHGVLSDDAEKIEHRLEEYSERLSLSSN